MKLATLVTDWDATYDAALPDGTPLERLHPYMRILRGLQEVAPLQFQPYQNDDLPSYMEKMMSWLAQFDPSDQPLAFVLASRIVFITQPQFEALQRRLFQTEIRRHFLDQLIVRNALREFDYSKASDKFPNEMDRTLFVPGSDSAPFNSFVHLNSEYFTDRERRRLVGPEIGFWTYPSRRSRDPKLGIAGRTIAREFESEVINLDRHIENKERLVVLDDFAGSGDDCLKIIDDIEASGLKVQEVILASVISTEAALDSIRARCTQLNQSSHRTYVFLTALLLPHSLRCFDGPALSYLDRDGTFPGASATLKDLSERLYAARFQTSMEAKNRHGYGGLALAFAFYSNCPDNSLPLIWSTHDDWRPLFRRVSRFI